MTARARREAVTVGIALEQNVAAGWRQKVAEALKKILTPYQHLCNYCDHHFSIDTARHHAQDQYGMLTYPIDADDS